MNKESQTAIITRAGSGIGFAVAEALVQQGTNVVLNGRNEDKLTRATDLLKNVELHLLDTGHFALEEDGALIAEYIRIFLARNVDRNAGQVVTKWPFTTARIA